MKINHIGVILYIFLIGCYNPLDYSLDDFWEELTLQIDDPEKIQKFKLAPQNAVIIYFFDHFGETFNVLYETPKNKQTVDNFIDEIEKKYDSITAQHTLILIFQAKLNGKKVDVNKLAADVYQYNTEENQKEEIRNIKHKTKHLEIVKAANKKWDIGDTLNFILPVRFDQTTGGKSTYFNYSYPFTLDYSTADDTLKVKGILEEKDFKDSFEKQTIDSLDLIFKVRITSLSDTSYQILRKNYQIGDLLDLPLKSYGRPIE